MFPTRRITTMGGDVFRDEYSLEFDGTSDYVNCGSSATLRTANFTISAWVKFGATSTGVNTGIVSSIDNADTDNRSGFSMIKKTNDKVEWRTGYTSTLQASGSTTVLEVNRWYHIVQTYDGSTQKGYIDGVLEDSDSYANFTVSTENFIIGGYYANAPTSLEMNGNISDVTYYNAALTANEVATIYNGREPYNHKEGVASSNLVSWWRMGDGDNDGFGSTGLALLTPNVALIEDMATRPIFTDAITGWTNVDFDTFVTSGLDISSAISDGSASHEIRSSVIDATAGDLFRVSFTIAGSIVPAVNLTFKLSGQTNLNSSVFDILLSGAGDYDFVARFTATDSTSYMGFRAASQACNFNISNFVCKKITGGNNGATLNMNRNDFVGDRP